MDELDVVQYVKIIDELYVVEIYVKIVDNLEVIKIC